MLNIRQTDERQGSHGSRWDPDHPPCCQGRSGPHQWDSDPDAMGTFALWDGMLLLKQSDIAAALTMEANRGIIDAFDERLHTIRPHRGQLDTAYNIRSLLKNSTYVTHQGELKVQDPYSLRCVPQIHGASKDALGFVKEKVISKSTPLRITHCPA